MMINTSDSKTEHAAVRLSSFLTANKIKHELAPVGWDFNVTAKDGSVVQVVVNANDLGSTDHARVFGEYHRITQALGYGSPRPVNRGPEPDTKLHMNDEPDLVSIRHRQYRLSPNPSTQEIRSYEPFVIESAKKFCRNRASFCSMAGIEFEDVTTYACNMLVVYLGNYRLLRGSMTDNVKKYRSFLNQSLDEYTTLWTKKGRSIVPEKDTAMICQVGFDPDNSSVKIEFVNDEGSRANVQSYAIVTSEDIKVEDSEEFPRRKRGPVPANPTKRKQFKAKELEERLGELSCEDLMVNLYQVATGTKHQNDTKRLAMSQYNGHRENCSDCYETYIALDKKYLKQLQSC